MPGKFVEETAYSKYPTLSSDQQQLLLNALQSNDRRIPYDELLARQSSSSSGEEPIFKTVSNGQTVNQGIDPTALDSSATPNGFVSFRRPTFGDPFLSDYANGQLPDFDIDLPKDVTDTLSGFARGDSGEKRKSFDDFEEEGGDAKRGEDGEKQPKKPGRKPVTAEPTTKRKAQNRAAQRAFRDRKEKHLSDLENKITDLQESSSATSNENSLLRAQVLRLQNELRDYRKRLSANVGIGGSPTNNAFSRYQNTNVQSSNPFDFTFGTDASFDSFASLPVQSSVNRSTARSSSDPFTFKRESSSGSNITSPASSNANQQHSNSMPDGSIRKDLSSNGADPFTPSFFNLNNNTYGFPQFGSPGPVQQDGAQTGRQGSNSVSDTAPSLASHGDSPSVSSNALSSCGASPEASPENGNANKDDANGKRNPFGDLSGFQFNPDTALFGDYREPQTNIFGDGDFTGGLYDDWLNMTSDTSYNFAEQFPYQIDTASPGLKKSNLMAEVDKQRDAADNDIIPIVPEKSKEERELMTCNKIWQQLRTCPKFQEGDIDIDGLCGELQKKATCSETGATIPRAEWENALWRIAGISEEDQQKHVANRASR